MSFTDETYAPNKEVVILITNPVDVRFSGKFSGESIGIFILH